jgi:hypothetical protein
MESEGMRLIEGTKKAGWIIFAAAGDSFLGGRLFSSACSLACLLFPISENGENVHAFYDVFCLHAVIFFGFFFAAKAGRMSGC